MIRSMMSRSNLSEYLWGEAFKTILYILNRVSNKSMPKIYFELWIGRKPSWNYFWIWDYSAEVRIYSPIEKKTDPRTSCCYFIRYLEYAKEYKFYSLGRGNKIVESLTAKFLELDVVDVESF